MSILASAELHWGVAYTLPGEKTERVDPVGGPSEAARLIRELKEDHGVTAERVGHYETPWERM